MVVIEMELQQAIKCRLQIKVCGELGSMGSVSATRGILISLYHKTYGGGGLYPVGVRNRGCMDVERFLGTGTGKKLFLKPFFFW